MSQLMLILAVFAGEDAVIEFRSASAAPASEKAAVAFAVMLFMAYVSLSLRSVNMCVCVKCTPCSIVYVLTFVLQGIFSLLLNCWKDSVIIGSLTLYPFILTSLFLLPQTTTWA